MPAPFFFATEAMAIRNIDETIAEIDEVTTTIAAAVEQQDAATREIARNIQQAAGGTTDVSNNISGVSSASAQPGSSTAEVLSASDARRREADILRGKIDTFLTDIRAA
jgi:methyl-accepting chemotaxis protein